MERVQMSGLRLSKRGTITVVLSAQSIDILDQLAELGIYGASGEEVAERLIDEALQKLVPPPVLDARPTPSRKRRQ